MKIPRFGQQFIVNLEKALFKRNQGLRKSVKGETWFQ